MAIPDYQNPIDIGNNPSVSPTPQQVLAVKQALAANSPKSPANTPNLVDSLLDPTSWSGHTKLFSAGDTSAATVYWPWVIKTDKITNPLDRYYMYFSTDHDAGMGGIFLASAPTPMGPWTQRGLVYVDTSTANGQTETPTVMWDAFDGVFRMFYQQISAKYGVGNASQAIGDQSTLSATSTDGINWTKDPNFINDIPSGGKVYGDGHTGYFILFRTPRGLFAYSLAGGGGGPAFVKWQCRGKSNDWKTDWRPLSFNLEMTQGTPLNGRRIEWNSSFVVASGGVEYWVGRLSDGAYGLNSANCLIGIAPISPDYRQLLERPVVIWSPTDAWETIDMRSVSHFQEAGILYVYYTIAKSHIGVISHVL